VIADLSEAGGHALASELGGNARFARCNVAGEADAAAAVALAAREFGAVHGLVNCAGVGTPAKVLGKEGPLALEAFNKVIQINLVGTFNMLRLAAAEMAKNTPNEEGERGVIINTASVAAFDGQIGQPALEAA
jgi:NAD(P)-dependent dehydrogenase (short-subunit alcohol dehydrogenase family)